MLMPILPWTIRASTLSLGQGTEGWTLHLPVADHLAGDRTFTIHVPFEETFTGIPVVHVGIQGFDTDQRQSGRLRLAASGITLTGFDLTVTSWRDSQVYAVDVGWLAVGP